MKQLKIKARYSEMANEQESKGLNEFNNYDSLKIAPKQFEDQNDSEEEYDDFGFGDTMSF